MVLTDNDALARFLTDQGVISFSERDGVDSYGSVQAECISFAIAYMKGRLSSRFDTNQLHRSPILREFTTVIACRTLCTRMGNPIPDSTEMRYQEIIASDGMIDQIYKGKLKLIDDLGNLIFGTAPSAPVLSNLRVNRRYPNEKVRVIRQTSMNANSQLERDFGADNGGYTDG